MQPITTKKTNTQITLSGVGQLKSAIASFVTTLQAMAKDDAFNKRSINITQDKDKPVLKVESKAGPPTVNMTSVSNNWRSPVNLTVPSTRRRPPHHPGRETDVQGWR